MNLRVALALFVAAAVAVGGCEASQETASPASPADIGNGGDWPVAHLVWTLEPPD